MIWNWQQPDWPHFTWDRNALEPSEEQFLLGGGILVGVAKHLSDDHWNQVPITI